MGRYFGPGDERRLRRFRLGRGWVSVDLRVYSGWGSGPTFLWGPSHSLPLYRVQCVCADSPPSEGRLLVEASGGPRWVITGQGLSGPSSPTTPSLDPEDLVLWVYDITGSRMLRSWKFTVPSLVYKRWSVQVSGKTPDQTDGCPTFFRLVTPTSTGLHTHLIT